MNRKIQKLSKNCGLTLVEVMVGSLITAVLVFIVISVLKMVQGSTKLSGVKTGLENEGLAAGLYLKNKMEGTRSFQNLAMAVPTVGASTGTGFYVAPDPTFSLGAPGPTDQVADVIYIVVANSVHLRGKLGTSIPGQWSISTLDGGAITSIFPGTGELIVLSRITQSEIIHATSAPVVSGPTNNIGTFTPTFDYTFGGKIIRNYVAGDFAKSASVIRISLDRTTNQLQATTIVGGPAGAQPHTIASNVVSFTISYNSFSIAGTPKLGTCPDRTSAADIFEHAWATQNSANGNTCYSQLSAIRFDLKFQNFLNSAKTKSINTDSTYTFQTNN